MLCCLLPLTRAREEDGSDVMLCPNNMYMDLLGEFATPSFILNPFNPDHFQFLNPISPWQQSGGGSSFIQFYQGIGPRHLGSWISLDSLSLSAETWTHLLNKTMKWVFRERERETDPSHAMA